MRSPEFRSRRYDGPEIIFRWVPFSQNDVLLRSSQCNSLVTCDISAEYPIKDSTGQHPRTAVSCSCGSQHGNQSYALVRASPTPNDVRMLRRTDDAEAVEGQATTHPIARLKLATQAPDRDIGGTVAAVRDFRWNSVFLRVRNIFGSPPKHGWGPGNGILVPAC